MLNPVHCFATAVQLVLLTLSSASFGFVSDLNYLLVSATACMWAGQALQVCVAFENPCAINVAC